VEHHNISNHTVSRGTFSVIDKLIAENQALLDNYLHQLLWWNERVNLVSRNVSRETVWEHIRHSLLISELKKFQESNLIVDAGTGGGLPGIPLALTHPQKHFVLNDLVTKKCLTTKQIAKKLELKNIGIVDGSIEFFQQEKPFLLISKHAFKINELYKMIAPLPWSTMILYKGLDFENELDGISQSLDISTYDLSRESEFYEGKALVIISR